MIHFKPKQAGNGWERKKIEVIVPFRSNKVAKKLKKYHCGLISNQNRLEMAEKDGIQKLSFRFFPTRRVI